MENLTVAKRANIKGSIKTNTPTSDIFRSQFKSNYEKKKEEQKRRVHNEIRRVSDLDYIV